MQKMLPLLLAGWAAASLTTGAKATPSSCDATAGNLVVNCGFESSAPAWTYQTGTFFGPDGVRVHSGGGAMAFGGLNMFPVEAGDRPAAMHFLTQTLHTVAGQAYDLSFWLLSSEPSASQVNVDQIYSADFRNNRFLVDWGGAQAFILRDYNPFADMNSDGSYPYVRFQVNGLVATSDTTEIVFGGYHNISAFVLDDVVLTRSQTTTTDLPEPDTAGLALAALAALGATRRSAGRHRRGKPAKA